MDTPNIYPILAMQQGPIWWKSKFAGSELSGQMGNATMNQTVALKSIEGAASLRPRLDEASLDLLFREARTHNGWLDQPVPRHLLEEAVNHAKLGPSAANSSPFRVLFVESPEGKERLKPALAPGNVEKTMSAPVSAIVAYDLAFYDMMPKLFPHNPDARSWFSGNEAFANHTAVQSGTLQAAYFLLALRAVGLDAGPLNGFDNAKVDAAFFAGSKVKSNFIINIGYGDASKLFPRNPRLDFAEMASFA
jgi:3-hydroxypropanoate dehydrogenase